MIYKSNKLLIQITLLLLSYIIPNWSTIVVQMQNQAITKDVTWQNMSMIKKPLIIPTSLAEKGILNRHNKSKTVYHKQWAENDVYRESDSLV